MKICMEWYRFTFRRREVGDYSLHSPVAQDRRFHWIRYLKKHERQKLRYFKKYFKKCGFSPFKFKIFRRSDDGELDTIHVMVPYGYSDEYLPKPEVEEDEVVPDEYFDEQTTTRPLYSVKYRVAGEGSPHNFERNGTASNSSRYDFITG